MTFNGKIKTKRGSKKFPKSRESALSLANDRAIKNLKKDHANRPLWVLPTGRIYLEATSTLYKTAYDFLVAVAEPVSRPEYIHEYKLTVYSLLAAVSLNLSVELILKVLSKLSKTKLPKEVLVFIKSTTRNFGKAKLVLKKSRLYIESADKQVLEKLQEFEEIGEAIRRDTNTLGEYVMDTLQVEESDEDIMYLLQADVEMKENDDVGQTLSEKAKPITSPTQEVFCLEIYKSHIETVKRTCLSNEYPLLEEYDFEKDGSIPSLRIKLKKEVKLRRYQSKSLHKMCANGRARSGIIVLPCGAGKTLTGIVAAVTIGKSCVVLCTSTVAVRQWKEQFLQFSTIKPHSILIFTSKQKDEVGNGPCILLTTYNMISFSARRSNEGDYLMSQIQSKTWGLLICDEVHVVPARLFRSVCTKVTAHSKLGLSATLLREDSLIEDLYFLIGPKLYEANWMDLTRQGYLANVSCNEVVCSMTKEYFREYLTLASRKSRSKVLLSILNPNKVLACEFLINHHESKGDKILVFCDNIFALEEIARRLRRKVIHGKTPNKERFKILDAFKNSLTRTSGTVLISKVGDVAINLPSANVLIQIDSHFGSRRQEAQRLGRILRPKSAIIGEMRDRSHFNAYFYSLVSADTEEVYFSGKRRQYLIENGYSFKSISLDSVTGEMDSKYFGKEFNSLVTRDAQMSLLAKILVNGKEDMLSIKRKEKASRTEDFVYESSSEGSIESHSHDKVIESSMKIHKRPDVNRVQFSSYLASSESGSDDEMAFGNITGANNMEYVEYTVGKESD